MQLHQLADSKVVSHMHISNFVAQSLGLLRDKIAYKHAYITVHAAIVETSYARERARFSEIDKNYCDDEDDDAVY